MSLRKPRNKSKPEGHKQKHKKKDVRYHNWFSPFLWSQIEAGVKHISVGKSMSTYHLVKVMQQKDPITFRGYPAPPLKVGLIAVARCPDGMMPLSPASSMETIRGLTMEDRKASW
jgi:hypothetical protein